MGTIVHKALQILGDKNLCMQRGNKSFTDDELGKFTLKQCDDLPKLTERAFNFYTENFPDVVLGKAELKTCIKWTEKAVAYSDGSFDPRNQNVFSTEQFFDIEIDKPWAKYDYRIGKERITGNLSIKGTVDLIIKHDENYYEILDYKTGKRINWATGEEKTPEALQKDTQLLLYYYALKNMYPEAEFYVSIFYINDGGVFSLVFDEDDYKKAEQILKKKFQYIKNKEHPRLLSNENSHWKCRKLCLFSEPYKEGSKKSVCQHMRDEIRRKGINKVVAEYGNVDNISNYGDGGGRLAEKKK